MLTRPRNEDVAYGVFSLRTGRWQWSGEQPHIIVANGGMGRPALICL